MKLIVLLSVYSLFLINQITAQTLKQKTKIENGVKEVFFYKKVKGKGKIKEGEYKKYFVNKYNPEVLIQEGQYLNDQKVGVWTFYNNSGDSVFAINLSNDSIIFVNHKAKRQVSMYNRNFGKFGENAHQVYPGATNYIYEVDFSNVLPENSTMPFYIEGDIEFYNILFNAVLTSIDYYSSQYYHSANYFNNFEGLLVLKINEVGLIENIVFPYTFEPALLKVKEHLMNEGLIWIPAQINGENIEYELAIPIHCSSLDNSEQYFFEIKFFDKSWIGDQIPYCNPWPYNLSPSSKIYERKY